jgi:transposase, IS30 family
VLYRRKYGTKIREKLRESFKKRIDTRPEIVNSRSRIGDFEGDTIVGLEKTIHILTHVDRKSRFLLASRVQATAQDVHHKTIQCLGKLPKNKLQSITYDNGVQFSKHEYTEQKLNIPIYFAFPYHSWERGTNENTNGLLRQYYPKKSPFQDIKQKDLDKIVKLINSRPRKVLNYLTPQEVFNRRQTKTVALRN